MFQPLATHKPANWFEIRAPGYDFSELVYKGYLLNVSSEETLPNKPMY
jgi:hypothetical protein